MKVRLKNFERRMEYSCFDTESGTGGPFNDIDGVEISGFCKKSDSGWIAVYPDPDRDTLVVQIDGTTWDLYASETTVVYNHHYDDAKTYFKITDGENTWDRLYEAWWKDVPHFTVNKWAASREDENSSEDIFGYILMLWQSEESKDDWIEAWSKHLPS